MGSQERVAGRFWRLIDLAVELVRLTAFRLRHRRGARLSIVFMSRDRLRYFQYYQPSNGRSCLSVHKSNRWTLGLAGYLFSSCDVEWLFSDFDRYLYHLSSRSLSGPIRILSWNGVAEIQDFCANFPGLEIYSVISGVGATRLKPRFVLRTPAVDNSGIQERIFFAGQLKTPAFFLGGCSSPVAAAALVAGAPDLRTMVEIFDYVDEFAQEPNISERDRDFIRMALAAVMREKYLLALHDKFTQLVTLCGPDFDAIRFPMCRRISYLPACDVRHMYRTSSVAVDFGSQCGNEALYPRSLEILESNPAALVQVNSRFSDQLFFGLDTRRDFAGIGEMLSCVEAALWSKPSERAKIATRIRSNANALMV